MDRSKATYIGDGLYVEDHGWQVELFTHNGIKTTNSVFLEPSTLESFLVWLKEHGR